ncbi:MAG TPA: phosphatidylglycerophosphatase A [Alphaproteobacteria bacterium]|nr:phosphatidylglycerophosphatase A [Alphaproteobacteria bacterium]
MVPKTVAQRRAMKSATLSLPLSRWSVLLAACGGVGYTPGHPIVNGAMVTSLATPFLLWPLYVYAGPVAVALVALAFVLFGTAALMDIHQHGKPSDFDARPVVIDEFVGAAFVLALGWPWLHLFAGNGEVFAELGTGIQLLYLGLLFRVFDILKPWPASWLDVKWHSPFSIIADDLVAAFYAALVAPLPFVLLH